MARLAEAQAVECPFGTISINKGNLAPWQSAGIKLAFMDMNLV